MNGGVGSVDREGFTNEALGMLVAFMSTNPAGETQVFGTGAVLFTLDEGRRALVLTARHVFEAMIDFIGVRRPRRHDSRALPEFLTPQPDPILDLRDSRILAVHTASKRVAVGHVVDLHTHPSNDLLLCNVAYDAIYRKPLFRNRFALDTRPPSPGETMYQLSFKKLRVFDHRTLRWNAQHTTFKMISKLSLRVGTVIESSLEGVHGRKWPSFSCSAPADPGMSGGIVMRSTEPGEPLAITGIISAGFSFGEGELDGPSLCGMVFPLVAYPVFVPGEGEPTLSVLDLIRAGVINDRGDGAHRIAVVRDESGYTVQLKLD